MTKWTDERRKKHAEAIRRWKPWEKSTGPKTVKGKEASKMNALKHGLYSEWGDAIRAALHHNQQFLRHVMHCAAAEQFMRARETNYKEDHKNQ